VKFPETFGFSVTIWLKDFFKDLDVLNANNIIFGFFRENYLLSNHIIRRKPTGHFNRPF